VQQEETCHYAGAGNSKLAEMKQECVSLTLQAAFT
jgi:hypothetical protein